MNMSEHSVTAIITTSSEIYDEHYYEIHNILHNILDKAIADIAAITGITFDRYIDIKKSNFSATPENKTK